MAQTESHGVGKVLLQAVIPAGVGGVFYWKGHSVAAGVLGAVAAVTLVSGLFIPPLYRLIDRFGQALGKGVAAGLTWALLAPMFFLVFVPGRLILKLRGIDPLCRAFPTSAPTYWAPRKPVTDPAAYRRQF
jgi:hypothetical protein